MYPGLWWTIETMTRPLLAHQTPSGRMYARSVDSEPQVPSITTVISQQPVDMTGWAGHMAATAVVQDERLVSAVGSAGKLRQIARSASDAAARFRDEAAERGDRVHNYAEQVGLRALGKPDEADQAREILVEHGEQGYADRFDEWWDLYGVQPLATEVTVWNHTVGYAGTLDLVANIGGKTCIVDYKTKGTDRNGRVKKLDPKVVMQLVAGLKAEEALVDGQTGQWSPWEYSDAPMLLGVAVGETEVVSYQANPETLPHYWRKFWSLRQAWEYAQKADQSGIALKPIGPPPATVQTEAEPAEHRS